MKPQRGNTAGTGSTTGRRSLAATTDPTDGRSLTARPIRVGTPEGQRPREVVSSIKIVRINNFVEDKLRPRDAKLVDSGAEINIERDL